MCLLCNCEAKPDGFRIDVKILTIKTVFSVYKKRENFKTIVFFLWAIQINEKFEFVAWNFIEKPP